eukprot:TRINITY_DN3080_c0_g1_i2.p3 TRINITY_DN3080_c0_g1~~TRINITY_DN3080_c0_g1_i2.p3  ORF type:complete len:198 (-),score=51.29 TRINITY_DN3080_c0_g1_i2:265-858(-)
MQLLGLFFLVLSSNVYFCEGVFYNLWKPISDKMMELSDAQKSQESSQAYVYDFITDRQLDTSDNSETTEDSETIKIGDQEETVENDVEKLDEEEEEEEAPVEKAEKTLDLVIAEEPREEEEDAILPPAQQIKKPEVKIPDEDPKVRKQRPDIVYKPKFDPSYYRNPQQQRPQPRQQSNPRPDPVRFFAPFFMRRFRY